MIHPESSISIQREPNGRVVLIQTVKYPDGNKAYSIHMDLSKENKDELLQLLIAEGRYDSLWSPSSESK